MNQEEGRSTDKERSKKMKKKADRSKEGNIGAKSD